MALAPGRDNATSAVAGGPPVPLADQLTIESPAAQSVVQAEIQPVGNSNGMLTVDTSGTAIMASYPPGGLLLNGNDTVENYQKVLRSVRVAEPAGSIGYTELYQFTVTAARWRHTT